MPDVTVDGCHVALYYPYAELAYLFYVRLYGICRLRLILLLQELGIFAVLTST
jgi:hypothetical protein